MSAGAALAGGVLVAVLAGAGCGAARTAPTSGPSKVEIPFAAGDASHAGSAVARAVPPAGGAARDWSFPKSTRLVLANGLQVVVVPSRALPLVQARLVVRAGTADGSSPAIASLVAALFREGSTRALPGAELARRIEALGADLEVRTSADATVLSLPLPRADASEGLALLAQIVREPRFDEGEVRKIRARAVDAAAERARGDGLWAAEQVVFRELYRDGTPERSAYAQPSPTAAELARVEAPTLRELHRRAFVPKASTLILVGDLDEAGGKTLADAAFGSWSGEAQAEPRAVRGPARPVAKPHVVVVHRPRAPQVDILLATVSPGRRDPAYPALRVASEVLGGLAGRLFGDVREKRGLAYTTWARPLEVAAGDTPFVAYAGTDPARTAQTAQALVDQAIALGAAPPTAGETSAARSYAVDAFAVRTASIAAVADLLATQDEMGLPDGYWDAYRRQLRAVDAPQVDAAAKTLFPLTAPPSFPRLPGLLVVAGDADVVAAELTRFGDVTVVDPEKEFRIMRTLPQATK